MDWLALEKCESTPLTLRSGSTEAHAWHAPNGPLQVSDIPQTLNT
jgi:hypothetical protein